MVPELFAFEFHYFKIRTQKISFWCCFYFEKKTLNYLKTKKAMDVKFVKEFSLLFT